MSLRLMAFAAMASVLFGSGVGQAATITINDPSPATFSVECDACSGILSSGALSPSEADAVDLGNASESEIASYLSGLLSTTILQADVLKFDLGTGGLNGAGNEEDFTFDVGVGYFFTKYATYTAFFYSTAEQSINFLKDGGGQGGLSNYGTVAGEVPLPAAGWLLLAGLGALVAMRRRA